MNQFVATPAGAVGSRYHSSQTPPRPPIHLTTRRETHSWLCRIYLSCVIDPAGGSYFIEQLTEELCQKAWSIFKRSKTGRTCLPLLRADGSRPRSIKFTHSEPPILPSASYHWRHQFLIFMGAYPRQDRGCPIARTIAATRCTSV